MALYSVVASENWRAAQVSQGFSSQFQSTLLTGGGGGGGMLNGMALTFECVKKIIIGSGGGYGVSKGADSKNMDQTNFC